MSIANWERGCFWLCVVVAAIIVLTVLAATGGESKEVLGTPAGVVYEMLLWW